VDESYHRSAKRAVIALHWAVIAGGKAPPRRDDPPDLRRILVRRLLHVVPAGGQPDGAA
jgi:hypothetical protein